MVKESKNKKFCDDFFKRYEKCKKIHFKKVDIDKIRAKVIGAFIYENTDRFNDFVCDWVDEKIVKSRPSQYSPAADLFYEIRMDDFVSEILSYEGLKKHHIEYK